MVTIVAVATAKGGARDKPPSQAAYLRAQLPSGLERGTVQSFQLPVGAAVHQLENR
jgi:hypothetical protein